MNEGSKLEQIDFDLPPDPWPALNEQLGYDKAFQTEVNDGLIALDVRTVDTPPFYKWLKNDRSFSNWREEDFYFEFHWHMVGPDLDAGFNVYIFANPSHAHDFFHDHISDSARTNLKRQYKPWKPCKKQIGTACARTAIRSMFAYKNVLVIAYAVPILPDWDAKSNGRIGDWTDESLLPKSPSGEPWDEVFAEWFFGVLKNAPRYKKFPSEPIPLSSKESNP